MAETPKWGPEPEKQAEFLQDFKAKTAAELAAIKVRLIWLLSPAFLILLVVLGLSLWTFRMVSDIRTQVADTEQSVKSLKSQLKRMATDQQTRPVFAANGFNDAERAEFYHLAEGSEVFPLEWLKALENKDTKNLFMDDLQDMGFLRDWDPNNRTGLPVGLTAAPARGLEPLGDMVGLNCAACHVGEMSYRGQRIRIDGAPNFLDTRTFFASLIESSFATISDADKLLAFIHRVKQNRAEHQHAEHKVRFGAKLVGLLKDKGEEVLVRATTPEIKRIIDSAKDEKKNLDLGQTVAKKKDSAGIRAHLLEGFENSHVKALLEKPAVKAKLEEMIAGADEGSLIHTFEEIYIGVRLLKARAVFLKKLGMVGTDERTIWGPGRVDAFGSARAFLFEEGYVPKNPVSYPFIWGLYGVDWFHYDNNTTTLLQRNFGQALGVGGVFDPKTKSSSLHPRNLYRLEALATKLKPPQWPEQILGKIDQESAKRGKEHYVKHCAACHDPKKGETRLNFTQKLESIKTDPLRAQMFAEKINGTPFHELIGKAMDDIMKQSFIDDNITEEEKQKFKYAPYEKGPLVDPKWRGLGEYSARPLAGVWATGPFLHNGSVPTLDDLLRPEKERPAQFYVGNREFDPVKLGYMSQPPAGEKNNYDATKEGNRNIGHEYGTNLKEDERKDLLEYLKSL